MSEPAAPVQRERGWWAPIAALLLMSAIPLIPPLRIIAPIEQIVVLLTPAMAACAVVAWWGGGRLTIALVWVALSIWVMLVPDAGTSEHFDRLQRGWSLLSAATFGLACVLAGERPFLQRALLAVGASMAMAFVVAAMAGEDATLLALEVTKELSSRGQEFADVYTRQLEGSGYLDELMVSNPALAERMRAVPEQLVQLAVQAASVFPALLALESLAALALAWALFHRLSRRRIGAPLARLSDFRFNDQMVWGLLLGVTLVLLPTLETLGQIGWMLLVFFGGLYMLRGLGVLVWLASLRRRWILILSAVLLLLLPAYLLAAMLGLGVGDTWADWRRPRPAT